MKKTKYMVMMVLVLLLVFSAVSVLGTHLTCDISLGDSTVKQVVDWRVNSNSIAVLNMPFEEGPIDEVATATDYSSTVSSTSPTVTGATWDSDGGHDGFGAYVFNGDDDRITIPDADNLHFGTSDFSISLWMRYDLLADDTSPITNGERLIDHRYGGRGYMLYLPVGGSDTQLALYIEDGTTNLILAPNVPIAGEWHHVVGVVDRNADGSGQLRLYFDDVPQDTTSIPSTFGDISRDVSFQIGGRDTSGNFHGSIDDVQIFNRALTLEQIRALFLERTVLRDTETLFSTPSEQWQACVTPAGGTESCSTAVQITDTNNMQDLVIQYGETETACLTVRDSFTLLSTAFGAGDSIPLNYACADADVGGNNNIPPLTVENIPAGTQSLALIMEDTTTDPDTTHWLAWNIDLPGENHLLDVSGESQGRNYLDEFNYAGPCPPAGDGAHNYDFNVYAVPSGTDLSSLNSATTQIQLENALYGASLTTLTGTYSVPCTADADCSSNPSNTVCNVDSGLCVAPVCGNNVREGSEVCDGINLNGATCPESTTGTPTCVSCTSVDTSPCVTSIGNSCLVNTNCGTNSCLVGVCRDTSTLLQMVSNILSNFDFTNNILDAIERNDLQKVSAIARALRNTFPVGESS